MAEPYGSHARDYIYAVYGLDSTDDEALGESKTLYDYITDDVERWQQLKDHLNADLAICQTSTLPREKLLVGMLTTLLKQLNDDSVPLTESEYYYIRRAMKKASKKDNVTEMRHYMSCYKADPKYEGEGDLNQLLIYAAIAKSECCCELLLWEYADQSWVENYLDNGDREMQEASIFLCHIKR